MLAVTTPPPPPPPPGGTPPPPTRFPTKKSAMVYRVLLSKFYNFVLHLLRYFAEFLTIWQQCEVREVLPDGGGGCCDRNISCPPPPLQLCLQQRQLRVLLDRSVRLVILWCGGSTVGGR